MKVPVGIDLGTTRSCVAFVSPNDPSNGWYGNPQIVSLADGQMTPSAILFEPDGVVIGMSAKNSGHRARECAQIFKREMPNGDWRFAPASRSNEEYSPTDLSRILLEELVSQAERATGLAHAEAVVTVPAYFGEPERRRTRMAAEQAGLSVLDVINEPTAAVISYLFQPGVGRLEESILVFDLGGGTFDTVVVEIEQDRLRVVAIDGDLLLGGQDFDATIAMSLSDKFASANPTAMRPTVDSSRKAQLLIEVEATRERLSATSSSNIAVWGGGDSGATSMNVALARAEVDSMVEGLVDRCLTIARRALSAAAEQDVIPTRVLFVGGMTKTPAIRERVLSELGLSELVIGAEPDLMVAKGAAIWAQKLSLEEHLRTILQCDSLLEIDRQSADWRNALRVVNADTAYDSATLARLLSLSLHSISSRGYALLVRHRSTDTFFLDYLLPAGSPLPYVGEPGNYIWRTEVSSWRVSVYEDVEGRRGVTTPEDARLVERVSGAMSRSWPEGTRLQVVFSMGRDQILRVEAWQMEDGVRQDPLLVFLNASEKRSTE